MSGRKQPPACKTCGQPKWRSKHPFGMCPLDEPIPGGPELMHLHVAGGWHDGPVKVLHRTGVGRIVLTEAGSKIPVTASDVLTPLRREVAV